VTESLSAISASGYQEGEARSDLADLPLLTDQIYFNSDEFRERGSPFLVQQQPGISWLGAHLALGIPRMDPHLEAFGRHALFIRGPAPLYSDGRPPARHP
jgi:hypothetical protein